MRRTSLSTRCIDQAPALSMRWSPIPLGRLLFNIPCVRKIFCAADASCILSYPSIDSAKASSAWRLRRFLRPVEHPVHTSLSSISSFPIRARSVDYPRGIRSPWLRRFLRQARPPADALNCCCASISLSMSAIAASCSFRAEGLLRVLRRTGHLVSILCRFLAGLSDSLSLSERPFCSPRLRRPFETSIRMRRFLTNSTNRSFEDLFSWISESELRRLVFLPTLVWRLLLSPFETSIRIVSFRTNCASEARAVCVM
jgi:hypothetical protein